jgi:hypothetical protein
VTAYHVSNSSRAALVAELKRKVAGDSKVTIAYRQPGEPSVVVTLAEVALPAVE